LFATDFSEYAKKILDCIAGFPDARDVILLHVIEEVRSPRGGGEIGDALFGTGKNLLKEEKRHLEQLGPNLMVTTAVKTSSDTAGAIIETAEEKGVSLIVVGARGKSLVGGISLGSVSNAILRRSRTSVLIMRHKVIEALGAETYEKFCPMILFRVLCPVDFSRYSDSAVALLSRTTGVGEIILFHVVSQGETEAEIEDAITKAKDQIEAIRSSFAAKGIKVRTIVEAGNPPFEITRISEEEDVSVIWMSSHGKGWFRELLLGSTASMVATNAKRPVIIIHQPEMEGSE
jgi:nucleotide-binding universal stress UspA family protein